MCKETEATCPLLDQKCLSIISLNNLRRSGLKKAVFSDPEKTEGINGSAGTRILTFSTAPRRDLNEGFAGAVGIVTVTGRRITYWKGVDVCGRR